MDNQIANNLMETISHGTRDFPLVVYKRHFNQNSLSYISCHWHNEIEITYCKKGTLIYTVNDKSFILDENNFSIVNSNVLHQLTMTEDSEWYALVFDPKFIYGFEESLIKYEAFDSISYNNLVLSNPILIEEIKEIIDLYFSNDKLKSIKINSALTRLYVHILEESLNNEEVRSTESSNHSIRVRQILDFINNNYKIKITIDDISKNIGLCRSEVCKLFKNEIGLSIADYILKLRIEKSIPLLLSNKMNITEIAASCGFNSSSYYAEAFKKLINMTPLEYKKKNGK